MSCDWLWCLFDLLEWPPFYAKRWRLATQKKKRKRRGFKHLLYLDFFPLNFISRFFFFSWWDGAFCIRPFFFFAFLLLKRTCEFYAASFFLFFFCDCVARLERKVRTYAAFVLTLMYVYSRDTFFFFFVCVGVFVCLCASGVLSHEWSVVTVRKPTNPLTDSF